jgi:DNA-binding NtrC family response regulator
MEKDKLPIVLIVDDEPHLNGAIRLTFEDSDYTVFSAFNGKEGHKILEESKVDVCVVDMRLPDTTGNEFITTAYEKNSLLKFIIYTGSIDYIIPNKLKAIGITEEQVFVKPIKDFTQLVDAVNKAFNIV